MKKQLSTVLRSARNMSAQIQVELEKKSALKIQLEAIIIEYGVCTKKMQATVGTIHMVMV